MLLVLFVRNETRRGGTSVTIQQAVDLMNRADAVVVDVRDKKEYSQGHIVNAINIPYAALETRADELNDHKDRHIIVACKMGQHSNLAGTILRRKGFATVSKLAGGMMEWRNQNLPVVKK